VSQSKRITVRFVGLREDDGDVRFGAFLKKLEAMKNTLAETDKAVSDGERSADFKVVDLRHESPAQVVIEEIPLDMERLDSPGHVIDAYYDTLQALQERRDVPVDLDYHALQKFKELQPSDKGITEVVFSRNGNELPLTAELSGNIEFILGDEEYEEGSVTGMLQHVNVHGEQRVFTIYPTAGEPKLTCSFRRHLRKEVVEAVDRCVEVFGTLKYRGGGLYPYLMLADHIDVYPDESTLPSAGELFGIAPNATGEKSSEEFVRDLRRGW
jgi:hypothetical protein